MTTVDHGRQMPRANIQPAIELRTLRQGLLLTPLFNQPPEAVAASELKLLLVQALYAHRSESTGLL
jgi:hypothetical protein